MVQFIDNDMYVNKKYTIIYNFGEFTVLRTANLFYKETCISISNIATRTLLHVERFPTTRIDQSVRFIASRMII